MAPWAREAWLCSSVPQVLGHKVGKGPKGVSAPYALKAKWVVRFPLGFLRLLGAPGVHGFVASLRVAAIRFESAGPADGPYDPVKRLDYIISSVESIL